ncbi:hypothetical protein D3C85_1854860 [compost metagenome]
MPLLAQEMQQQGRKSMQENATILLNRGVAKREELHEFLTRRGRINDEPVFRR